MKKLLRMALAAVLLVAYLPMAEAGDSAMLGLSVSFDRPIEINAYPPGPHEIKAGETLTFKVHASDPDAVDTIMLHAISLPFGSKFVIIEPDPMMDVEPTYAIGEFTWTPTDDQVQSDYYSIIFQARSAKDEVVELDVEVLVFENKLLRIWSDPEGPFKVKEGYELLCRILSEDLDTTDVRITAMSLPGKAVYEPDARIMDANAIFTKDGGTLTWTPEIGQAQDAPYIAIFEARNTEGDMVILEVQIVVVAAVISVDLQPSTWVLGKVKKGEIISNVDTATGEPLHKITNKNNIGAFIDFGYVSQPDDVIHPGLVQGKDTYVTWVEEEVLDPAGRVNLGLIQAGEVLPLVLKYGAPTSFTLPPKGHTPSGHSIIYEIRAYPATE